MSGDLEILVVSCDKYADLWPVFFKLKRKYWSDCKFKTFLGSNCLVCDELDVETICIGEDISWADNVKRMLESISSEYILLLLEDFFIDQEIDSILLDRLFQYVKDNNVDCLRLEPSPPPVRIINRQLKIGMLTAGAPYYVSTQPAIWKKEVLVKLCRQGFSAWDFEIKNSKNSIGFNYKFMGVKKNAFYHKNGVERGMYYKSTVDLLSKEHIMIDANARGVTGERGISRKLKLSMGKILIWLNCWKAELKSIGIQNKRAI